MVVAGTSVSPAGISQAFRWTAQQKMAALGFMPGGNHANATAVSADGSVVVGNGNSGSEPPSPTAPFRWTASNGIIRLDAIPGFLSVYRERCVRRWTDGDRNVPDVQQRGVSLDRKHRRCWSRTFWRRKQPDKQCIGNLRGRARSRGGGPPAVDWRRTVDRRRWFGHSWTIT
jgi:hypothetical protein